MVKHAYFGIWFLGLKKGLLLCCSIFYTDVHFISCLILL